jgi:hypothetical protein
MKISIPVVTPTLTKLIDKALPPTPQLLAERQRNNNMRLHQ